MKNLETSSLTPFQAPAKWRVAAILLLSFVGFADAAYLTAYHFLGQIPACSFGNCEKVLSSPYAVLGGVPIALLGALYYLTLFLLVVAYLDTKRTTFFSYATRLTVIGLLASFGLVYLQLFVLLAICVYCMVSAATSTLLFLVGIGAMRR